jgi:hypothetical protein
MLGQGCFYIAISGLRDFIRDALYVRCIANFRVLCPNKMIGLGPRSASISDCEAKEFADLWGSDPVHPSHATFRKMVADLVADLLDQEARCTDPARPPAQDSSKRKRVDDSLNRAAVLRLCPGVTVYPQEETADPAETPSAVPQALLGWLMVRGTLQPYLSPQRRP